MRKLTTDIVWTAGVWSVVRHQLLPIFTIRVGVITQALVTHCRTYEITTLHQCVQWFSRKLKQPELTADFVRTAACVVGHADDHLPRSMANRHRHAGAVVLQGYDRVVVAAVHAAAVLRGFPHLAVCAGNARAVSAGCRQKYTVSQRKMPGLYTTLTQIKKEPASDLTEKRE